METEPLETAALQVVFASLDSIILPNLLKKRPSVMRSASLPQGSISKRSAIGIGGSGFGGHPSRAGLEIDDVAPTHVAAPSTTGWFDCRTKGSNHLSEASG